MYRNNGHDPLPINNSERQPLVPYQKYVPQHKPNSLIPRIFYKPLKNKTLRIKTKDGATLTIKRVQDEHIAIKVLQDIAFQIFIPTGSSYGVFRLIQQAAALESGMWLVAPVLGLPVLIVLPDKLSHAVANKKIKKALRTLAETFQSVSDAFTEIGFVSFLLQLYLDILPSNAFISADTLNNIVIPAAGGTIGVLDAIAKKVKTTPENMSLLQRLATIGFTDVAAFSTGVGLLALQLPNNVNMTDTTIAFVVLQAANMIFEAYREEFPAIAKIKDWFIQNIVYASVGLWGWSFVLDLYAAENNDNVPYWFVGLFGTLFTLATGLLLYDLNRKAANEHKIMSDNILDIENASLNPLPSAFYLNDSEDDSEQVVEDESFEEFLADEEQDEALADKLKALKNLMLLFQAMTQEALDNLDGLPDQHEDVYANQISVNSFFKAGRENAKNAHNSDLQIQAEPSLNLKV